MKRLIVEGIVLTRINFGEADRILTYLTPNNGKVKVIAKGVRKSKSKLAGGIELFTVAQLSLIDGRSEIKTLISARLKKNYSSLSKDLSRSTAGYEVLKTIHKITDDNPASEYFDITVKALSSLNDIKSDVDKTQLWFYTHLLWLDGYAPNLATDSSGANLSAEKIYSFDYSAMTFVASEQGSYNANHIKLLRIAMAKDPKLLQKVKVSGDKINQTLKLLTTIFQYVKT